MKKLLLSRVLLACVLAAPAFAEVRLASPFTDHMVLQRDLPVPIWGTADPGEQIRVTFAGQSQTTTAGPDGRWRAELNGLAASAEPRELVVAGRNTVTLQDVLVGEVWLGSGQSNMAFTMSKKASAWAGVIDEEKEIAAANYPLVRMFTGEGQKAYEPRDAVPGTWQVCTPENVPGWSAVGYYFARDVHRELGVPVGFVTLAYGASCAHAWIRREAMLDDPQFKAVLERFDEQVRNHKPATAKELAQWEKAVAEAKSAKKRAPRKPGATPVEDQHNPTVMFNGMIAPFVGFPIRGVLWYQGESITAPRELFPRWNERLITDWRKLWGRHLPFYFVQLAALERASNSPQVREWQAEALKVPNTAMAVTIDIGDRKDVHPHNKAPLGARLARLALVRDYGLGAGKMEYSGPLFASATVEGSAIRTRFAHLGGGLVAKDGALKAFEIAGADGKYVPAEAVIDGDSVVIRSAVVTSPVTARYAWANYPEGANLYNAAGLPAAPFRTDHPVAVPLARAVAGLPQYAAVVRDETAAQRASRLKWFREARFGMFVHWGVYAVPAGSWGGRPVTAEWIMNRAKIPIAEYRPLAQQFTAAKYDPAAWVALANEAGMKYIVLTSKHHDGFALYDSAYSDWNAVKASAAKRDLIQPLADAARAAGMKFGLYYSQSQDWVNRGGGKGNTQPWDEAQKQGTFDEYLEKISLPQTREILERYKPDILWWDTEYSMTPARARPFFELAVSYPDLMMNNRLGGGALGDTQTPEQHIPPGVSDRAFEVCMTMNRSWGYRADDNDWKSARQLIRNLSDITSKGGNYLLNVGPTAEGVIPPESVERLRTIGRWMRTNGEAIYATEAGPFTPLPAWGRATQKTEASGKTTLYVHVWEWPEDGRLLLPGIRQPAHGGRLLAGGAKVAAAVTPDGLMLTLPGAAPDADVSVVALQFEQPLQIESPGASGRELSNSGTPLDPSASAGPKH